MKIFVSSFIGIALVLLFGIKLNAQAIEWIKLIPQIETLSGVNFQDENIILSGSTSSTGVFIELNDLGDIVNSGAVFGENRIKYSIRLDEEQYLHFNSKLIRTNLIGSEVEYLYDSTFMHGFVNYSNYFYLHNKSGNLIQFDLNTLDSQKFYIGKPQSKLEAVEFFNDDELITCYNRSEIDSTGSEKIYLDIKKQSLEGIEEWTNSIPQEFEFDHNIILDENEIYILTTEYELTDINLSSVSTVITKINKEGEVLWTKEYVSQNQSRPIRMLIAGEIDEEGSLSLIGSDGSINIVFLTNTLLLKLDREGNILFENEFELPGANDGISLKALDKQSYLISGVLNVNDTSPFGEAYLMKVNSTLSDVANILNEQSADIPYPNPFCDVLKYPNEVEIDRYEIFNMHGSKLLSRTFQKQIELSSLPEGNYFLLTYKSGRLLNQVMVSKLCK